MLQYSLPVALLFLLFSCGQEVSSPKEASKAQKIIKEAIEAHGGDHYLVHDISFDFRNRSYQSIRNHGQFEYRRIFKDSIDQTITDVLTNSGLKRYVEGNQIKLNPKDSAAYSNSVNSVIYFAMLPYFLTDPAVHSSYLDSTTIRGEPYHEIMVTFSENGGGKDYEDQFVYWFHRKTGTMDYLAYNYQTDGGGARFRSAINKRREGGIRFADYENYKPNPETMDIASFDSLYNAGLLEKLSTIENTNIQVQ